MKVVKLLKLYVENFRGIKNFVLTPDGRSATVQGGNGTGKSTLMAAFLWLLTGKDAQGRENYNVFPLGTDGNRLSGCSPTVTATLSMPDGHTLILQRSICERWTKRRGSAETEYNGDETRYFIDEVPVSAGEYSSAIFGVFPEKLLPLLLNAVWFSEQTKDYKERRRLLLEQFGSLQPADVFTANPELSDLESMLGTHSVDEFSRICTERRKRYKDSLSALPARIDENRKQLHPVSDARAVKNERSKLNVEIAKLQYEIEHTTADAVQRHNQQELEKVQQYLEMIPNKRRVLESSSNAGWLEEHNRRIDDAARGKQNAMCRVETLAAELRSLNRERDLLAAERDRLRVEWVEVNRTVPDIAQTCPTCGQALPAELVQEAQENFNVSKSERLSDIAAKGAKAAQDVEKMEKKSARLREDLDTCERAAKAAAAAYDMVIAEKPPVTQMGLFAELDAEETNLKAKAEELRQAIQASAQAAEQVVQEKRQKLADMQAQSDAMTSRLAEIDRNAALETRIQELEAEQRDTLHQLEEAERGLSMCEEYTRTLVTLLTERVNKHFPTVRFKLFEQQKNGGLREVCEAMVDGVPYGALNTASKMQANVEIVQAFSRAADISLPLFLDNRESVTDLTLPDEMQVINLNVIPGEKLGLKGD
ncbi:AAA family ATPase [Ruthenibacterium lactatiformans]|uniref:AAA family ATPase n=1 Tax=Ruthenibacterium lactatiformans TaxID=1550024 RepID=UPI0019673BBA|nr:AAA family ATPase [Ruthenibacterium lactatiformans]MBN3028779.1 AAA family ATPase [Ruthenibacterium lactatiformans]